MTKKISQTYKFVKPRTIVQMDQPLALYKGEYILKALNTEIKLKGEITFKWLPSRGVRFQGIGIIPSNLALLDEMQIIINNQSVGSCFVVSSSSSSNEIRGLFKGTFVMGDKSVAVDRVEFEVCNLREFFGRRIKVSPKTSSMNLMVFSNEEFEILILKHLDFHNKYRELRWSGGYTALYSGSLRSLKQNKPLTYDGCSEILTCLFLFLSFLNGRRCSPVFRKGIFGRSVKWQDDTPYHLDQFKQVTTWPPHMDTIALESLWVNFSKQYKDIDCKSYLEVAIHTYIRANGHVALSFEGISMMANTLELLFNVVIVEKKKIILGKDIENLQASNKIRLLLAQILIPNEIPEGLQNLANFKKQTNAYRDMDGPELFTQIRNTIVHGQAEKRKKLADIPAIVLHELLQLSIWYVEVALLYLLEYDGKYRNRTSNSQWAGQGEELVPWRRSS